MTGQVYSVLTADGEAVVEYPEITKEKLLRMYKDMVLSRIVDDWLVRLQRAGKVFIHAPIKGQEASMVGVVHALTDDDWLFPTYRELGAYIARGVPVEVILNRWAATSRDILKGRDLSIFGDRRFKIVPAPVPVATHIPITVGFAYAAKMRREKIVALALFGDGASSKGDFHEGINMAGVLKVPAVFVCQNNQYAISLPFKRQTAAESIAVRAIAYGIKGDLIDGNDILAVYTKTSEAVENARNNNEPALLELRTYRLGPHSTADDPGRYRNDKEAEEWMQRDPITRFRKYLERMGLWGEEDDKKLHEELTSYVKERVDKLVIESPKPETILDDVYAVRPWHLEEELQELLDLVYGSG